MRHGLLVQRLRQGLGLGINEGYFKHFSKNINSEVQSSTLVGGYLIKVGEESLAFILW